LAGENDFLITAKERDEIASALLEAGVRHEMVVYPNVQHGFFCDERDTFDKASRDDAWKRVLKLYAAELHA
jgi:carboxymethylenebutenolidase